MQIKNLFVADINREIEEVIKVDQAADEIVREEIDEYVATTAIRKSYVQLFEAYSETLNKPREKIGIWISGFFGAGKSSFAKMFGLAIANRTIAGESASTRFAQRTGDQKLQVLLKTINEKIPTHVVIFDVSTERGIISGNQTLTQIMYGLFLQSLGYAKNLDLAELEITLEDKGQLERFEQEYRKLFKKEWSGEKGKVAFALNEASRVLHSLDRDTYPSADSWVRGAKDTADVTPNILADRSAKLMNRRKPGHWLLFVIDEVGQYVARDVQKMLDLQAVEQSLGRVGRGKHWLAVTSQEKLSDLVSGLDDSRIELLRLKDRFPNEVHLEQSDITEVTSRRVLAKNAAAEKALGELFDAHRARLAEHTRLSADTRFPELSREAFIDLYPLLPYQIDLVISVVSGLRTQGGASRHVGGANRTIIKLAQQLLINPEVNLADAPVGTLVRLDQVYNLVESNIGSEIRAKITAIAKLVKHPLAQPVAKAICLLQVVKAAHRGAEDIAAVLHPSVAADSQLAAVKEALRDLETAHMVRLGDDGYRIPTPAEDDWERVRNGISPKPGESKRIQAEALASFWQPQPSHTLFDTKSFKAGLFIDGREVTPGDMAFQFRLADEGKEFDAISSEFRSRSQTERKEVFWAVPLNDAIDGATVELFRSKEILSRKERETRGESTASLITEERARLRRHEGELRRLLRAACLSGHAYFRGNDRSPRDGASEVAKHASEVLGLVLPEIFERFREGAAKAAEAKKGTDALLAAESLHGLPGVFTQLRLLRDENGRPAFQTESGALKEVMNRIEERTNYGEAATGRLLEDKFSAEPFGWDFEVVRLLVLSLLRAENIEATSKGQTITSVTGVGAREAFQNNNQFRQASFRPKKGIEFQELVKAAEAFKETFGREVSELNEGVIVAELRKEIERTEDTVGSALATLNSHRLPGTPVLDSAIGQMKAIVRGSDDNAIATFNSAHRAIKEAIKRATELEQALTEPRLRDLETARLTMQGQWPFLQEEADLPEDLRKRADALADRLARETFFKELPTIEQDAGALRKEYERRALEALNARVAAYTRALDELKRTPGWSELGQDRQRILAEPLERGQRRDTGASIPQLRGDLDACEGRINAAVMELHRFLDGDRVVTLKVGSYFAGGIETAEQLEAALGALREELSRLVGSGKKVIVR